MRWTLRIGLIIVFAWLAYVVSPYVALYRLSKAIERRDVAQVGEYINFRAFRLSLTKQLVGDYLDYTEQSRDMSAFDKKVAAEAGATVADPLVAQLLTPETLIDLLDDGWPQQVVSESAQSLPLRIDFGSLSKIWNLYITSESRGFTTVFVSLPPRAPAAERYRLQLRLSGLTWRLSGVDLPVTLRQKLIARLPH